MKFGSLFSGLTFCLSFNVSADEVKSYLFNCRDSIASFEIELPFSRIEDDWSEDGYQFAMGQGTVIYNGSKAKARVDIVRVGVEGLPFRVTTTALAGSPDLNIFADVSEDQPLGRIEQNGRLLTLSSSLICEAAIRIEHTESSSR